MAAVKTINFLPEVFRSNANKKFLTATLDQLVSEPNLQKINGYVGRQFAPTYKNTDNYIIEPTAERQVYQLEPSLVVKDKLNNVKFVGTYIDLLQKLKYHGALTDDQDRLFSAENYSFNPSIEFDKFINFSQYYWLPNGPNAVSVSALPKNTLVTGVVTSTDLYFRRQENHFQVEYEGSTTQPNPTIYLQRGITYTLSFEQSGGSAFWIQTEPGLSGYKKLEPTVSSRNVLGVANNGSTVLPISFTPPLIDAQDQYNTMELVQPVAGRNVDYATELAYNQIHNRTLAELSVIGGIAGADTNLNGKFLIFLPPTQDFVSAYSDNGLFDYDPEGFDGFKFDGGRLVPRTVLANYQPFNPWESVGLYDAYNYEQSGYGFDEGFQPDLAVGSGVEVPLAQRGGMWRINLVTADDGQSTIVKLSPAGDVPYRNKVYITSGSQTGKSYFKNTAGVFEKIPDITATLDTLYYQDGSNSRRVGVIKLIDPLDISLNIEEQIIGLKSYTSPNGVEFTNGLMLQFDDTVTPAIYQDGYWIVEGVGQSIKLVRFANLTTPEENIGNTNTAFDSNPYDSTDFDVDSGTPGTPDYITINRSSIDGNAWSRSNRWFHIDVIKKIAEYTNSIPLFNQLSRANRPIIEFNADIDLINHGKVFKAPIDTINFSVTDIFNQIENKPIGYELDGVVLDGGIRIIFANSADALYKNKIYTITVKEIAGLKNIHLELADDYQIESGHQIIVTNGTYKGNSYYFDGSTWQRSQEKTKVNQPPLFDMFDTNGISFADNERYYGTTFAGTKLFSYSIGTGSNDAYLGFPLKYQNFNQIGDIVFENNFDTDTFTYLEGSATVPVPVNRGYVGFNVGLTDKIYKNNWTTNEHESRQYQVITYFYNDTRYFEIDISPMEGAHNKVFVNNKYINQNNYTISKVNNIKVLILNNSVNLAVGDKIDILIHSDSVSDIGYFQVPDNLDLNAENKDFSTLTLGQLRNHVAVKATNNTDIVGTVPGVSNLRDLDVANTSGSILQHSSSLLYPSLFVTNNEMNFFQGIEYAEKEYTKFKNKFLELAVKNSYDVSDVPGTVDKILTEINKYKTNAFPWYYSDMVPYTANQRTVLPTYTILDTQIKEYEITSIFNDKELGNKSVLVYYTPTTLTTFSTITTGSNVILVDIDTISAGLVNISIPTAYQRTYIGQGLSGPGIQPGTKIVAVDFTSLTITMDKPATLTGKFQLSTVPTTKLLVKDYDYSFNPIRPTITLDPAFYTFPNDQLTIIEYNNTDGNFVPETPTKLGLYPKFRPSIYTDNTYQTPIAVIQGHDGSITPAFDDYRDDLLLELEIRIYNNIKVNYNPEIFNIKEIIPGKSRTTDYSLKEFNQVLGRSFLRWAGDQQVDFTNNTTFDIGNPWTWNYKKFRDVIDGERAPGFWRGIFKYLYDTDRPHTNPWEMFGFSIEPIWWSTRYGSAPYTGKNAQLWEDVRTGYIAEPGNERNDVLYARPNIKKIIPIDEYGLLRSPDQFLSADIDSTKVGGSFAIGDLGPVEAAWHRSSNYPFAVQQAMALLKPGVYFSKLINTNNYNNNNVVQQFAMSDTQRRLTPKTVVLNGEEVNGAISRASGYAGYITNYLKYKGIDPFLADGTGFSVRNYLNNIGIQLGYKVGGYTDKKLLKVLAEHSSPGSTNESVIIPDENYQVILNKSSPTKRLVYSAVLVQRTTSGYSVSGYNLNYPFFTIIPSLQNGNKYTVSQLQETATIYRDYQNVKLTVPYGYEFNTRQELVDFLVSYGRFLTSQGLLFDEFDTELKERPDFVLSAKEFLAWSQQGWKANNIIVLNPIVNSLTVLTRDSVVDQIENAMSGTKLLDQEFNIIKTSQLTVLREEDRFSVKTINNVPIALAELNLVQYEHVLLFDNSTVFNDVIYAPELGNRQSRLKLIGSKTSNWTGKLNPPGFIYNSADIASWQPGADYRKGSLIEFKNNYYVALDNLDAVDKFDSSKWQFIDKEQIKTGLLPNFATNAKQFENFYDSDDRPSNEDIDKFGAGLIGFRERSYLSDLNVDSGTQLKFYQGLLKQKGTLNSIQALTTATFSNLGGNLDLYEEWAIRVGEYGALDINQFFEIDVTPDVAKLTTLLSNDNTTIKDTVVVGETELYKKSNQFQTDFARIRDRKSFYDDDIATAGFVNLDDIDTTIFDMTSYNDLEDVLSEMGSGYKIWVAKDFDKNWNVYRVSETGNFVSTISYSLDNLIKIETVAPHNFVGGEVVAIKNLDPRFNGVYRVLSVIDLNNFITVAYKNVEAIIDAPVTGNGTLLKLESMRFTSITDAKEFAPLNGWKDKDKLFVEVASEDGKWGVYDKTEPFTFKETITKLRPDYLAGGGEEFGHSIALNNINSLMFVGEPGNLLGAVRVYTKDPLGNFNFTTSLFPSIVGAGRFGHSVALGNRIGVVGAPGTSSNTGAVVIYEQIAGNVLSLKQTLTPPNQRPSTTEAEFGYSVAISDDDRWVYIGAPGDNSVHAYGLRYAEEIIDNFTTTAGVTQYFLPFTPVDPDSVTLISSQRALILNIDYTISAGNQVDFLTTVFNDTIVAIQTSYFTYSYTLKIDNFMYETQDVDRFGHSVKCNSVGNEILVTAPKRAIYAATKDSLRTGQSLTGDSVIDAGQAYIFSRSTEVFNTVTETRVVTPRRNIPATHSVRVNGVLLVEGLQNDYNIGSNSIFFSSPIPSGYRVEVDTNVFNLESAITADTPTIYAQFGYSGQITKNSTRIAIGEPYYAQGSYRSGRVHDFLATKVKKYVMGRVPDPVVHDASGALIINDVYVPIGSYLTTPQGIVNQINSARIPGVTAELVTRAKESSDYTLTDLGYATMSGDNVWAKTAIAETEIGNSAQFVKINSIGELTINVDSGYPILWLGLNQFDNEDTLLKPYESTDQEYFGTSVAIVEETNQILVGSQSGTTVNELMFETNFTVDKGITTFYDSIIDSGSVYAYDYLVDYLTNKNVYVFGQQLSPANINSNEDFGRSIAVNLGEILIGSPVDSTIVAAGGVISKFENLEGKSGWDLIRSEEDKVDVSNILKLFLYNKETKKISSYLDFINPIAGRILGIADQDLDYKTVYDPASYNKVSRTTVSNNSDYYWTENYVGKLWWNLDLVKYIDYEQGELLYRAKNWSRVFPGSTIQVNEWIESSVLPSQYVANGGDGTPVYPDNSAYVEDTYVDSRTGIIKTKYFYWVSGRKGINTNSSKTSSAATIQNLIEFPEEQGITYAAVIKNNAFKLFGLGNIGTDLVLHVDYEIEANSNNTIHAEYQLVKQGSPDSEIPASLYDKMIDSLTGFDKLGQTVPDPKLLDADKIGPSIRPRQTLVLDKISAIRNLVGYVNNILIKNPIVERFDISKLLSAEPKPNAPRRTYDAVLQKMVVSGEWHKTVNAIEELEYLDIDELTSSIPASETPRVLINSVPTLDGLWAIYQYDAVTQGWNLYRIQSYNTPETWEYTDWYASDYDPTQATTYVVEQYKDVKAIKFAIGETVKVNDGGQGKFVIYRVNGKLRLDPVGYENGTLQLNSSFYDVASSGTAFDGGNFDTFRFDQNNSTELRYVMESIRDQLFTGYLSDEFSNLFFVLINYILSEQVSVDWIFKSSFISVVHKLRKLAQYPSYISDNQNYYEDYINEVKPYRTKIRDYLISYDGLDVVPNDVTDFDAAPVYNFTTGKYYKPALSAALQSLSKFSVESLIVGAGGSGFSSEPIITISAPDDATGTRARARALIDQVTGSIIDVILLDGGSGYSSTPTVTINGDGTGAIVYAQLGNSPIRSMKTEIKFDRVSYTSDVKRWPAPFRPGNTDYSGPNPQFANITYSPGDIVGADGVAYQRSVTNGNITLFPIVDKFTPGEFNVYSAENFTTAGDRISAYYVTGHENSEYDPANPTSYIQKVDLAAVVPGVEYPGNKIQGLRFQTDRAEVVIPISTQTTYYGNGVVSGTTTIPFTWWSSNSTITSTVPVSGTGSIFYHAPGLPEELYPSVDNPKAKKVASGDFTLTAIPNSGYRGLTVWQSGRSYANAAVVSVGGNFYEALASNSVATVPTTVFSLAEFQEIDLYPDAGEYVVEAIDDDGIHLNVAVNGAFSSNAYVMSLSYNVDPPYLKALDTLISSSFTEDPAESQASLIIEGGAFVDTYSSHAPEELIPGRIFDSVIIRVFTAMTTTPFRVVTSDDELAIGSVLAYAQLIKFDGTREFRRLSKDNTTTLSQPLNYTDANVHLTSTSFLPIPSPAFNVPGSIYINGEKINFYTIDYTNNVIGQITRGADGTLKQNYVASGAIVNNGSKTEEIDNAEFIVWQNRVVGGTSSGLVQIATPQLTANGTPGKFNEPVIYYAASSNVSVTAGDVVDGTGFAGAETSHVLFLKEKIYGNLTLPYPWQT